jgi:hypothetical protein
LVLSTGSTVDLPYARFMSPFPVSCCSSLAASVTSYWGTAVFVRLCVCRVVLQLLKYIVCTLVLGLLILILFSL